MREPTTSTLSSSGGRRPASRRSPADAAPRGKRAANAARLSPAQLARYRRDGFLILPGLFSPTEVEALRAELPALFAESTPANFREKVSGEVRTAMGLHRRNEVYARLVRHPRLLGPAMQIAGERLYIQ